jgi:hypothetical protein
MGSPPRKTTKTKKKHARTHKAQEKNTKRKTPQKSTSTKHIN